MCIYIYIQSCTYVSRSDICICIIMYIYIYNIYICLFIYVFMYSKYTDKSATTQLNHKPGKTWPGIVATWIHLRFTKIMECDSLIHQVFNFMSKTWSNNIKHSKTHLSASAASASSPTLWSLDASRAHGVLAKSAQSPSLHSWPCKQCHSQIWGSILGKATVKQKRWEWWNTTPILMVIWERVCLLF